MVGIFAILVGTVLFPVLRRCEDWHSSRVEPLPGMRRLTNWVMNDPRGRRILRSLYVACGIAIIMRGILQIAGVL
jgi:hypothetical protein